MSVTTQNASLGQKKEDTHSDVKLSARAEDCEDSEHLLSSSSPVNSCSICAITIPHYVPEYFCGEVVNPACEI